MCSKIAVQRPERINLIPVGVRLAFARCAVYGLYARCAPFSSASPSSGLANIKSPKRLYSLKIASKAASHTSSCSCSGPTATWASSWAKVSVWMLTGCSAKTNTWGVLPSVGKLVKPYSSSTNTERRNDHVYTIKKDYYY